MPSFFGRTYETLESPFLNEEIAPRDPDRESSARLEAWTPEQPEARSERDEAFAEERLVEEALADEALSDREIIGTDNRTVVADTLRRPNRWICAIDIQTDNPKWPGATNAPQFLIKSRGTGVLIGPRYVLTAAHVLGTLDAQDRMTDVKGLLVSPARNGDNATNPFGRVKTKAVRVSARYLQTRTVGQGAAARRVQFWARDDYALLILESDLSARTHSKMSGPLGYWGLAPSVAEIRRLDPADLEGKEVVVVGYPGDTCDRDKWVGTAAQKQVKIDNCWNNRNDVWASRQWHDSGTLSVDPNLRVLYHTADTYRGQSGGPIYLTIDGKLQLAGIHVDQHTTQQNRGYRVTRRMLGELEAWINDDAGYRAVSIQNDCLIFLPKPTVRPAKASEVLEEALHDELEAFQTSGHHYEWAETSDDHESWGEADADEAPTDEADVADEVDLTGEDTLEAEGQDDHEHED